MGIYLLVIMFLFTAGPAIIFHKNKDFDYDNKWGIILPPLLALIYAYALFTKAYETDFGFYLLIACLVLSIYSSIVSIIMYSQTMSRKRMEEESERIKTQIKKELSGKCFCPHCNNITEINTFCSYCGKSLK